MSVMEPPLDAVGTSATDVAVEPSHQYHAEAHALSGYLHQPVYQRIDEKASVKLRDYRGDHKQEKESRYNLEGVVTFEAANSRVSGNRNLKNKGWITLSTSIVEGLNVLEVITADRVVSQVSTEHAYVNGHVPTVTFLGAQFVNLRLSGVPLQPKFRFGICGDKPAGTTPYVKSVAFLEAAREQVATIAKGDLPVEVKATYSGRVKAIDALIAVAKEEEEARKRGENNKNGNARGGDPILVTCSLIESIDIGDLREIIPGLKTAGNVLFIPEFGTVALGEVEVKCSLQDDQEYDNYFHLKMLQMNLGCVGNGSLTAGAAASNGQHKP